MDTNTSNNIVANQLGSMVFHNHDLLENIPVVNPGDWFGKTFLIEIGGSYTPLFLIVEADNVSDAIDELADSEEYGHHIIVDPDYLDDYPEEDRHYGPSGQIVDLDHLMIYGQEGCDSPFPCTYFGGSIPDKGISPIDYCDMEEE